MNESAPPPATRNNAIYANTYRTLHLWTDSTGFRTHGLRHRSLSTSAAPRVSEEFLVNTRYTRHDRESEASIQSYFADSGVDMLSLLGRRDDSGVATVALPEGPRLRRELGEALGYRRSRREYTGDPIELAYLATLLRAGCAITGEAAVELMAGGESRLHFRTAPSGGGLYPIELYVVSLRVSGLPRGVHRFEPRGDALLRHGDAQQADRLMRCFAVPEEIITLSRACAVLLLIARPWRALRKYGSRGTRYVLIEAGAVAQNVHLAATALGIGTVDCASVYDDEAHAALGIDGLYETLVHTIVVGRAG